MKKNTQYLYGISAEEFRDMLYPDAIQLQIDSAKKLLDELVSVNYRDRDNQRIKEVLKHIKINKESLLEVEGG